MISEKNQSIFNRFTILLAAALLFLSCSSIPDAGRLSDLKNKMSQKNSSGNSNSFSDDSDSDSDSENNGSSGSSSNEFENNLKFTHFKNRVQYENENITFEPGDWVGAYANKIPKEVSNRYNGKDVFLTFEFELNKKVIAVHKFKRKFDVQYGYMKFNILPDPNSTEDKVFRWDWSGSFAQALSKLKTGEHEITLKGYIESGSDKTIFAQGNLVYNNKKGNGKMAEYAKNIEKNKGFDIVKENEEFTKKYGRAEDSLEQINTTVFNNCGREVVISFANKKSYSNSVRLRLREYLKITVSESETIYISWKGKSTFSGPTVGSFEKGKTINLCQ